ncbi:MAG: GIY-YIG nuclease family protein [Patescibacteria group bacterium]|nr:GIY-YIG nuclease family protein [Patescibacteria group bacterium]
MFYTYVLLSQQDNKLYIGWTNNIKSRLSKHNNKKVKSTKDRGPFILIYLEACLNKKDAISREKSLKTGFGRAYLKKRLKNFYMGS